MTKIRMTGESENKTEWETAWRRTVEKENRTFSVYPPLVLTADCISSEANDIWLELSHFIVEDLRWLLALDDDKFLAYIFYSEQAYRLIASTLRESPPGHLRVFFAIDEDIREALAEIDQLVFLILTRMATDAFSENLCKVSCNSMECLLLPPVLDFVLLFGTSNPTLVKEIIFKMDASICPFLSSDVQLELILDFFRNLTLLTEEFWDESAGIPFHSSKWNEAKFQHVIMYSHDAVATVQILLDLFPDLCLHLCQNDNMIELVKFYSKVLPAMQKILDESTARRESALINKIRVDLLKIARAGFKHSFSKGLVQEDPQEKSRLIEECLTIMMDLASEPDFIQDYGVMFPAVAEISALADSGPDVDSVKAEHILRCLALSGCELSPDRVGDTPDPHSPLITAIQDVLPHLSKVEALECLKRHECDVERTIAAILDGAESPQDPATAETGKKEPPRRRTHLESTWFRDEDVDKSRYAKWLLVPDDTYDDEYDDTYDGDDVVEPVAGDVDGVRRPFVVPRVLRSLARTEEKEEEEEEENEDVGNQRENDDDDDIVDAKEEDKEERSVSLGRHGKKGKRNAFDRAGDEPKPGQSQNKQILRERCHKTVHKSRMGNHNRKREAERKRCRGSMPF